MKRCATLILLLIAAPALTGCATDPPAVTPAEEAEIRLACEERWGGNWSGRATCVELETEGLRRVQQLLAENNVQEGDTTPEAEIFEGCALKWRSIYGHTRWSGVATCFELQLDGYRRLHP